MMDGFAARQREGQLFLPPWFKESLSLVTCSQVPASPFLPAPSLLSGSAWEGVPGLETERKL